MEPERFDAIVLGTGQAGKPLALDLAERRSPDRGRRTGVRWRHLRQRGVHADQDHGRQCPRRLPGPRAAEYGVRCGPVAVDMTQVRRRKQTIVDDFRTRGQRRLEQAENVELDLR